MDKRLIVFFFFALFLLPLVSPVSPFVSQTSEGCIIVPIVREEIKVNTSFDFNFHVINSTNGYPLSGTEITCQFHLYNQTGDHSFAEQMLNDPITEHFVINEFVARIDGKNFSSLGNYAWGMQCNGTIAVGGCSDKGYFKVTYDGNELTPAQGELYTPLFIVLFGFILTIFFIILKLPDSNERDEEGKIMSISYLKYFRQTLWIVEWMLMVAVLYLSSNLAFNYLQENLFANILFVLFRITFGITPIIIIVMVVYMFASFFHDREFQNLLNRGIFPQGRM